MSRQLIPQNDGPDQQMRRLAKMEINKVCGDCFSKTSTHVQTTHRIFLCMDCAALHRENQWRVKGLSTSNFTAAEVRALSGNDGGNEITNSRYLARLRLTDLPSATASTTRRRDFIRQKYIHKRWYTSGDEQDSLAASPGGGTTNGIFGQSGFPTNNNNSNTAKKPAASTMADNPMGNTPTTNYGGSTTVASSFTTSTTSVTQSFDLLNLDVPDFPAPATAPAPAPEPLPTRAHPQPTQNVDPFAAPRVSKYGEFRPTSQQISVGGDGRVKLALPAPAAAPNRRMSGSQQRSSGTTAASANDLLNFDAPTNFAVTSSQVVEEFDPFGLNGPAASHHAAAAAAMTSTTVSSASLSGMPNQPPPPVPSWSSTGSNNTTSTPQAPKDPKDSVLSLFSQPSGVTTSASATLSPSVSPGGRLAMMTPPAFDAFGLPTSTTGAPYQRPMMGQSPAPMGMYGSVPMNMPGPAPMGMQMPGGSNMYGSGPMGMQSPGHMNMPGPAPMGMSGPAPMGMQGPMGMSGPAPMGMPGPAPMGMQGPAPMGMPGPATMNMAGPMGMPGPTPMSSTPGSTNFNGYGAPTNPPIAPAPLRMQSPSNNMNSSGMASPSGRMMSGNESPLMTQYMMQNRSTGIPKNAQSPMVNQSPMVMQSPNPMGGYGNPQQQVSYGMVGMNASSPYTGSIGNNVYQGPGKTLPNNQPVSTPSSLPQQTSSTDAPNPFDIFF